MSSWLLLSLCFWFQLWFVLLPGFCSSTSFLAQYHAGDFGMPSYLRG